MPVETYTTNTGYRYRVIRCRPITRHGAHEKLPKYTQARPHEDDQITDDIGEEILGEIDDRPVYVELRTDHAAADYEVTSQWKKGKGHYYQLVRR